MLEEIGLDEEIETFLGPKKTKSTLYTYRVAFKRFLIYYRGKHGKEATFGDFINRIYDEYEKAPRDRKRVAEIELNGYVKYLEGIGKSNNSILTYIAAIRNYLRFRDLAPSMRFVSTPAAIIKEENKKHRWTIEDIRRFADAATNYRDKAVILCLFQSGLGLNELCSLDYRHVKANLEADKIPVMLRLVRGKTQIPFVTFFGRDAMKYLKLYLATRNNLNDSSPLFTKWGSEKRVTPAAIESKFRELAESLGFTNGNGNGYNPARPHSLRAAFNSRLMGKIDGTLREFWMGHAIGKVAEAYLAMPDEEITDLYMDAEKYLAIEKTSRDEIIEQKEKKVQVPKETLAEIEDLRTAIRTLTRQHDEMRRRMDHFLGLMDLDEDDTKTISEMVQDYLEQKMKEERAGSTVKEWVKS